MQTAVWNSIVQDIPWADNRDVHTVSHCGTQCKDKATSRQVVWTCVRFESVEAVNVAAKSISEVTASNATHTCAYILPKQAAGIWIWLQSWHHTNMCLLNEHLECATYYKWRRQHRYRSAMSQRSSQTEHQCSTFPLHSQYKSIF